MFKCNAECPKQGSRRFNYIVKSKYIDDLGIVNLWSYSSYLPCQRFAPKTLLQYWDTAQTSADVKCAMCISVVARSPFDILVLRPVPTLDYQSRHWAISPDIGPSVQTLGHQSRHRANSPDVGPSVQTLGHKSKT